MKMTGATYNKAITIAFTLVVIAVLTWTWAWLFALVLSFFGIHLKVWQSFLLWLVLTSPFLAAKSNTNGKKG